MGDKSWMELRDYIGFTDNDSAQLRRLLPFVRPRLHEITDSFYERVLNNPHTRKVLQNDAQIERLRGSMARWCVSLLEGPHDTTHFDRGHHIGRVHVRVGLSQEFVCAAMAVMRQDLSRIARQCIPDGGWEVCDAIMRVTDLELAIMTVAYIEAHEAAELRSLQGMIVANLPSTVLCLDGEGRVTAATLPDAIVRQLARPGTLYSALLPPSLLEAAQLDDALLRASATGQEVSLPRVQTDDGRIFRVMLVPLEHPLARTLIHIEELTDIVEAESRLIHAESLARIGSMSAQLAHEIRNPIAAISATLQVITKTIDTEDRRHGILLKVQDQVHRLDRLVRDLLNYSRPMELELERADLLALAREAIAQSGATAELLVDGPAEAWCDPDSVIQILVNLIQNARDAKAEWVGVRVGPGPHVVVLDDGPGVAQERQREVFEPFVTSKTHGTGLGLAISRKRAEAQSGHLELVAGKSPWPLGRKRGAGFRLSLPTT